MELKLFELCHPKQYLRLVVFIIFVIFYLQIKFSDSAHSRSFILNGSYDQATLADCAPRPRPSDSVCRPHPSAALVITFGHRTISG